MDADGMIYQKTQAMRIELQLIDGLYFGKKLAYSIGL
jgi:hypothetical protein